MLFKYILSGSPIFFSTFLLLYTRNDIISLNQFWYVDGNWPERMKMTCLCYECSMTPCANILLLQDHGMTIWKMLWDNKTCFLQPRFHSVYTTGWTRFWGDMEFSHSAMLTFSSTLIWTLFGVGMGSGWSAFMQWWLGWMGWGGRIVD